MRLFSRFLFFLTLVTLLTGSLAHAQTDNKPQIVIDAAHGGTDAGVKEGAEIEKDWNLKFAKALDKAFETAGFQVTLTRLSDEEVDAETRMNLINSSKARVVLVIHADREWTHTQNGPFLVVEPPNQSGVIETDTIQPLGQITTAQYHASLKLAQGLAQRLAINSTLSDLSDSRGAAGESLTPYGRIACLPHQSLRNLSKPAVLITPLFLTSPTDLKKFTEVPAMDDFTIRVVQGVCDYLQIPAPIAPTPSVTPEGKKK